MFYVKKNINDEIELEIELYEDDIYTYCRDCGKIIQIENEHLADILKCGDLSNTSVCCKECSKM